MQTEMFTMKAMIIFMVLCKVVTFMYSRSVNISTVYCLLYVYIEEVMV